MIVFAIAAIAGLVATYLVSPPVYRVHAAKVKWLGGLVRAISSYPMADFITDGHGRRIDTKNRMIGVVDGKSCDYFGIRDGAEFIADYLSDEEKGQIEVNDVVVVDAPTVKSQTGMRLRIVESVDRTTKSVRFRPDASGERRRDRPLSDISARVRFVREPA